MKRQVALGATASALIALAFAVNARLSDKRSRRPPNARSEMTQAHFEALLAATSDAVIVLDADLRVIRQNAAAIRLFPALADHRAGSEAAAAVAFGLARQALSTGQPQPDIILTTGPRHDRRRLSASAMLVAATDTSMQPAGVVLTLRDITDRTPAEADAFVRRLRRLHEIASLAAESERDRIELALRFAVEELGLDQAYLGALDGMSREFVIQNVVARNGPATYGPGRRYPLDQTLIGRVIELDDVLAAPDVVAMRKCFNITYHDEWKSYIAMAVRFAGERYGAIGFKSRTLREAPFSAIDIELVKVTADLIAASLEREVQRARLDALAFYDALTGLPNRVLLADRLAQCIRASKRHATRFALLFLDLDDFKIVNDSLGHAAGDTVLRIFAARLTQLAREGDTVARLGGDEFVIVAPHIETERDAVEFAQRIAHNAGQAMTIDGNAITVNTSIGVSLFPDHANDADGLLALADAAMFEAKANRERVRIAEQRLQAGIAIPDE